MSYVPPIINETGNALLVYSHISGEDYIQNKLMSGRDGELLLTLFMDAGLKAKDFSFTCATEDIDLKGTIKLVKPDYIIALGNEALKALTKKSGIKKHRGTTIDLHPSFDYVCLVHPTYSIDDLRGVPNFRKTIIADLRNTQHGEPEYVEFKYWRENGQIFHDGDIKLESQDSHPTKSA